MDAGHRATFFLFDCRSWRVIGQPLVWSAIYRFHFFLIDHDDIDVAFIREVLDRILKVSMLRIIDLHFIRRIDEKHAERTDHFRRRE
jgi:hypothetical protein